MQIRSPPCNSAQLVLIGELGDLLDEANARIVALERGRIVLIATLAAFPLMLMTLLVMVLSRPLAPPEPSLSLAAAVIGALLTGALVFLGASATAALTRPTHPRASPRPGPAAAAS